MICNFDLDEIFYGDIIKLRADLLPLGYLGCAKEGFRVKERLLVIVDRLGQLSATAQSLNAPITAGRHITSTQFIYLLVVKEQRMIAGLLKMGPKDLYLHNEAGEQYRCIETPAVLDFYVHRSQQRKGLGRKLIEYMLKDLGTTMCKCAIDRPSKAMLAFMEKHYGLKKSIAQNNNFTVYPGFFDGKDSTKLKSSDFKSKEYPDSKMKPHLRQSPVRELPTLKKAQAQKAQEALEALEISDVSNDFEDEIVEEPPARTLRPARSMRSLRPAPPAPQLKRRSSLRRIDEHESIVKEELSMAEIMETERMKREANRPTSFRRTKYNF